MAKYRMDEMNDLNGTGERRVYPRLEIQGQVNLDKLAEMISMGSTFTPGDIVGMIRAMTQQLAVFMALGYSVKIDGLGSFTASLKLAEKSGPGFTDKDPESALPRVRIRGVHFRPDKKFVGEVSARFHPERSRQKQRHSSSKFTPEERLSLARKFLDTAPYLTVRDYCGLTGLLHTTASKELRHWSQTPGSGIAASGKGSHGVYIRRDNKQTE